jgi:hypothetical protein
VRRLPGGGTSCRTSHGSEEELGLGDLAPLDEAIPELEKAATALPTSETGAPHEKKAEELRGGGRDRDRTCDQRLVRPPLYR